MQKFESKYEGQKIPEWYSKYFDYQKIKSVIKEVKDAIKGKQIATDHFRKTKRNQIKNCLATIK